MEPITTYRFLDRLAGFTAADWSEVETAADRVLEHLEEWDSAWNLVLALGLQREAHPAMSAARDAGQCLRVQAVAGAAMAAVAARGQIGERRFRALYRPFAELVPAEPELRTASFCGRLAVARHLIGAWK